MIAIALVAAIPLAAWGAWLFLPLWGWFAVPLGLPALTWGQMVGLLYIVGVIRARGYDPRQRELTGLEIAGVLFAGFLQPVLALAMGAVLHWIVG